MMEGRDFSRKVGIGAYYMMKGRYINIVDKDKVLGEKYELTNKGKYLIDQYALWIREQEKKWFYQMRLSHKKSKELKENT
jgi:hypothetical protein